MPIEVELKFAVQDREQLEQRLAALQPSAVLAEEQVDRYFAHPSRNFAVTDEALRLRRVGESNYITYKGPKLDDTTKTRREIEIALPEGDSGASQAGELLLALGFTAVATVAKQRVQHSVRWQGEEILIAVDTVDQLGQFVELEIMADEDRVRSARDCLVALADHLRLANTERRSYLELLLAKS